MEEVLLEENEDDENIKFLSSPAIKANYALLQEIGVIDHIENLSRDIRNYRSFLARGLDIFNHTSIEKIMDATVIKFPINLCLRLSLLFGNRYRQGKI